jgi:hypothetical protein
MNIQKTPHNISGGDPIAGLSGTYTRHYIGAAFELGN